MAAHMLDHFVFSARRLSERTKSIVFATVACAIVANFWWFRGVAWGIDGPINDHWGLGWRKVGCHLFLFRAGVLTIFRSAKSWNIYEL
jgi:dolichyl-phosphate-mannose-protein mannosyltransferase